MAKNDVLEELVRKAAEGAKAAGDRAQSLETKDAKNTKDQTDTEIADVIETVEASAAPAEETPAADDAPAEAPKVSMETREMDVPVVDNVPEAADVSEDSKKKMAQIRESLAMLRESEQKEEPAYVPKHAAPSPKEEKRAAEAAAAAETVVLTGAGRPNRPADKTGSASKARRRSAKGGEAPRRPRPNGNGPKPSSGKKRSGKGKSKKQDGLIARTGVTAGMIASVIGVGAIISMAASFIIVAGTYKEKFLPNTYINSVKVAGLTTKEAEATLLADAGARDLTLTDHNGNKVTFKAEQYDARYVVPAADLDQAASEADPYGWFTQLFGEKDYKIDYDLVYSPDKLRALINSYDWGTETSQDAYIRRAEDGHFEVVPETLGDQFDVEKLMSYIDSNLKLGKDELDMLDSGCYDDFYAKVKSDDLTEELALYDSYANMTITFDFEDRTKTVTSDMIVDWLLIGENGQVVKDDEGRIKFKWDDIAAFVQQMAAETDTFGKDRSFHATVDGWITVPWVDSASWDKNNCSNYGWRIDQDSTTQQIIDLIRAGETVTVEPIYFNYGKGYVRATDDIGNTYVEADISEQHFWVYKEGTVVLEGDFVSGTEKNWERRTPRGICQILDMQRNKVLGRYEVQGYECPVSFWMAFNNCGCGFHDLSRGAYGGQIYQWNGSHGCLNLSWSKAQEMYNTVFVGMPVIVHD